MNPSNKCPHCEFIKKTFGEKIETNREYWIMTEVFVYLHGGKDYCNNSKREILKQKEIDKNIEEIIISEAC